MGCVSKKVFNACKSFCSAIYNGIKTVCKAAYRGVKKVVTQIGKFIGRGLVLIGEKICKICRYIWKNRVKIINGIKWIVDKVEVIINGIAKIMEIKKKFFDKDDNGEDEDMGTNNKKGIRYKS
jgi:phage-related protein